MALARDASTPAVNLSGFLGTQTASLASNSFTPPAGSVIVVTAWAGDSFQNDWDAAKPTISNSGTALTWTQISSQFNNGLTNKSIRTTSWWAFTATAPGSMTATVAEGVQAGQTLTFMAVAVDVWTGALTSGPIGATANSNSTTGGTRTVAITPTALGSALVMAGGNWNDATTVAITAGTGCFLLDDANQGVCALAAGQIWLGSGSTTPTLTTTLSSVNLIASSSSATFAWSVVAYEVLPGTVTETPLPVRPYKSRLIRKYRPQRRPMLQVPSGTVTQLGDGTAAAGAGAVSAVVTEIAPAAPAGAAAVTAAVTQIATASLAGAATVTAKVTQIAPAAAAGAAAVTDAAVQAVTASSAGAGAVTDVVTQIVTASLTGAGSLTAAASTTGPATAALAGAGSVTALVTQIVPAAAAAAGSVTTQVTQVQGAALAGAAAVTDVVTQPVIASLAGAGSVTANASVIGGGNTANLAGAAAVTAKAVQIITAAPASTGSLTALATQAGKAALTAAGAITAAGTSQGAIQAASSTPAVTAVNTSASSVTDPRDGASSVTAAVTSTPAVTDPRDGVALVTAAATSSPTVT
jgi:hypothetical protein